MINKHIGMEIKILSLVFISIIFCLNIELLSFGMPKDDNMKQFHKHKKIKVITSTYFAHKWSDIGCYKRVSKRGKRLGNFVALNFLPGGSIITIPQIFKTTTFEVADTFGGSGYTYYKGKKYWKVDILKNKNEWHDDFDYPLDLYVIKFNKKGPTKNKQVYNNSIETFKKLY